MRKSYFLAALGLPYLLAATGHAALADAPLAPFTFHETQVLGTSLDLSVTAADNAGADEARTALLAEIERLRGVLSTYDGQSELSKLNQTREPVAVSSELIEVLKLYEVWQEKSQGAYSGRIGELAKLWKRAEEKQQLPSPPEIAGVLADVKKPLWKIDDAGKTVQRLSEATINVDSLGKGFIVSRAAEKVRQACPNVQGLMVNVGGDVTVWGSPMYGKKFRWTVGIANPDAAQVNARPLTEIRVTDYSVATSGHYERGYTIGGKQYSHVLDPRTGAPVGTESYRSVKSATAIAGDNATANALATALCVLPFEEGLKLVEATPGAGCLIVLGDGTMVKSEVFRKYEVPHPEAPAPRSHAADHDGARWPADFEVTLGLTLKQASERPYVAVWVEDEFHQYVTTLAFWGNDERYIKDVTGWWKIGKDDAKLVRAVSRATRPAGKYQIVWDGKNAEGKQLPQGKYFVCVETVYEHGGHAYRTAAIDCGDAAATAKVEKSAHFDELPLTYVMGVKK